MAAVTADAPLTGNPFSHDPSAPEPTLPQLSAAAADAEPRDELDSLLDFDFSAITNSNQPAAASNGVSASTANPLRRQRPLDEDDNPDLGIDSEIQIRKKPRAPQAKLDEDRLLGSTGIPKLRRIFDSANPKRPRFRGKGHEFSDVARLLATYQLWLDDMFPKAKFADGVAMVEKLGHKKSMQVRRRQWIEDGKPKMWSNVDGEDEDDGFVVGGEEERGRRGDDDWREETDHAELYAQPTPQPETIAASAKDTSTAGAEEPGEDELDALLAEEDAWRSATAGNSAAQARQTQNDLPDNEDAFADEMEAMAEMDM